jgi:tRNA threonylcarbamoyl adenosine modification protein YeaZ
VRVLVLDTATPAVTAAVVSIVDRTTVTPLVQRSTVDERAHGELLAPAVREVLAEAGIRAPDLAAIVVGLGPGPFTGLRVGLVTAATMAQALAIPAYGVCSLDAIGWASTRGSGDDAGPTLVATDARRREIYWALYRDGVALTPPAVGRPAAVVEQVADRGVRAAVGDGAVRYANLLPFPVRDEPRYPPALALAELAAPRVVDRAPGDALTPLYLRRPDAAERASQRGTSEERSGAGRAELAERASGSAERASQRGTSEERSGAGRAELAERASGSTAQPHPPKAVTP